METTEVQKVTTLQSLLTQDSVKKRFEEMLGKKAAGFISSIISATKANKKLAECEPNSVLSAAVIAATLDLPIQNNLGFAAIVPYNESFKVVEKDAKGTDIEVWKSNSIAQFQMMYKGFIQLGMRTGQYQSMNVSEVYEGELVRENRFTGEYIFDPTKKISDKVIGYMAYFKLITGFEKTVYWPIEKIREHAKRYSKTYGHKNGRWTVDFDGMAKKTVLKNLLAKYGPLSVDVLMQQAVISDQGESKANEEGEMQETVYADNPENNPAINPEELRMLYELKKESLTPDEIKNAERILNENEEQSYTKLQNLLRDK